MYTAWFWAQKFGHIRDDIVTWNEIPKIKKRQVKITDGFSGCCDSFCLSPSNSSALSRYDRACNGTCHGTYNCTSNCCKDFNNVLQRLGKSRSSEKSLYQRNGAYNLQWDLMLPLLQQTPPWAPPAPYYAYGRSISVEWLNQQCTCNIQCKSFVDGMYANTMTMSVMNYIKNCVSTWLDISGKW